MTSLQTPSSDVPGRRSPDLSPPARRRPTVPAPVEIAGVPLHPLTMGQTLDLIDELIAVREPCFFITANLYYARVTDEDPRVPPINRRAVFILADGMPFVWLSRWLRRPLPERVAGSDLISLMCGRAATLGHRVFLLGGAPGVAEKAAANLQQKYPGLVIAGIEVPPFRQLSADETEAMLGRIRAARPDVLFVAFGQPKGEIWMSNHCQDLGVPVSVQIGASLDFLAGNVRRAPKWIQKTGFEWVYRISQEPRRLFPRYWRDILFVVRYVGRHWPDLIRRRPPR